MCGGMKGAWFDGLRQEVRTGNEKQGLETPRVKDSTVPLYQDHKLLSSIMCRVPAIVQMCRHNKIIGNERKNNAVTPLLKSYLN